MAAPGEDSAFPARPAPPRLSSEPKATTLLLADKSPPQAGAAARMRGTRLLGLRELYLPGLRGALWGAPPSWGWGALWALRHFVAVGARGEPWRGS